MTEANGKSSGRNRSGAREKASRKSPRFPAGAEIRSLKSLVHTIKSRLVDALSPHSREEGTSSEISGAEKRSLDARFESLSRDLHGLNLFCDRMLRHERLLFQELKFLESLERRENFLLRNGRLNTFRYRSVRSLVRH
jgi:hypothetical protein